ncbi:MAG: 4'-phosphopantetheinyl transferase superfamily protein [Terriglobales bacterium]|jgi:4'-phosphopantetheinyl transferase
MIKEVTEPAGDSNSKQRLHTSWLQAPSSLTFPAERVDVWSVRLDGWETADFEASILFPDELGRASRFHFEKDRLHFSRCRFALRKLLGGYLQIPADKVRFECLAGGKPRLVAEQNPQSLQFNVSHSAGMALIAVGSQHRLGVDIEKIRSDVDTSSLAERFFSLRERAGLRSLPDQLRVQGFFACWTRKEAFLKATGEGLSFPLADFSVTTHPHLKPALEEVSGHTEGLREWCLADLSVAEGYRATVAVEAVSFRLQTYAWN